MANATLRERQTQYKSCPQELYKLNAQQLSYKLAIINPLLASTDMISVQPEMI